MDYNQAYQTILTWITDNNNKEITAAIMRDVLKTLLDFADENIGDTSILFDKDNTVDAINELKNIVDNINISQPLVVHNGSDDPNVNPPVNFNAPDIYVRVDGILKTAYMYNGMRWVEILTFKIPTRQDGLWLGNVSSLNFVGAEWQLTFDPGTGQLTMEIVGGGGSGITPQDLVQTPWEFKAGQANKPYEVEIGSGTGDIDLRFGNKFYLTKSGSGKLENSVRLNILNPQDLTQSIEIYVEDCGGNDVTIDGAAEFNVPDDWRGSLLISVSIWSSTVAVSGIEIFAVYNIAKE